MYVDWIIFIIVMVCIIAFILYLKYVKYPVDTEEEVRFRYQIARDKVDEMLREETDLTKSEIFEAVAKDMGVKPKTVSGWYYRPVKK